MQVPLTLEHIGDLDSGAARLAVDKALAIAVADIDDRGDDGKPREVTIKIVLQRLENGTVAIDLQAGAKLPALRPMTTFSKTARRDDKTQLLFQGLAPEDPDQRTLDEVERREK